MIFPMWPEYFYSRAKEAQATRRETWIYLCVGALCLLLAILFKWFVCIALGPGLIGIAVARWQQLKWENENVLQYIRIGKTDIDILNAGREIIRTVSCQDVRNMEVRRVKIRERSSAGVFDLAQECRVIIIYIEAAKCFEDLKLWQNSGEELFSHPDCIAMEYSDEVWGLLNAMESRPATTA